ncbi:MAG: hypothetical protein IJK64_01615 [Clostridia bacterium]|nr:hypothetical protein [Clostridia bacterium]
MSLKRLLALFAALATVLALSACHVKNQGGEILSDDEILASQEAVASSQEAASIAVESAVAVEMNDIVKKEIGKTEKNKQVVLMRTRDYLTEYWVFIMDRKGVCQYTMSYQFYDDAHYTLVKRYGDRENDKLVKHNDDARLLVYKNTTVKGFSYQECYDNYVENQIWTIVK